MGVRFCSVYQTHLVCESTLVKFRQRNWMKTKKKVFVKNWSVFSQNQVKTKKDLRQKLKVFTAIWDYIWPEFVGFICVGWIFLVWLSSAQISMGGSLNLDGGTLNLDGGTRTPASPLQFKYWSNVPWVSLNSCILNFLLVWSHQAEIVIVKRLKQKRNNVTRVLVEPKSYNQSCRKNDAFASRSCCRLLKCLCNAHTVTMLCTSIL